MGLHEGILAAAKPWPEVRAALEKHCGTLQDQGTVAPEQWLDPPQGEDAFHVASRDGRSYLLDPAMVLTTNPDLVVSLSGESHRGARPRPQASERKHHSARGRGR